MARKKKTWVNLRGTLPYRIAPDEDWFIAKCELLHVNAQGKTKASAVRHLRDAVIAFLWVSMEDGTIHEILKDCGFHFLRLGNDAFWVSPKQRRIPIDHQTLQFSSRFSIRGAFLLPKHSEHVPEADLPWVVAFPKTDESARAA